MFTTFHARWVATGLAVLALPLHAQQHTADDARADVPAPRYQPAYEYKTPPVDATTPDRHWKTANRTVAGTEPDHAHHAPPAQKEPTPAAQEHHHHGEHH